MDDLGLFDLPAGAIVAPPEPPTNGQRRQQMIDRRIRSGSHPLGYVSLHPDAARDRDGTGLRCGTCLHRQVEQYHNRSYPKCQFGNGIRATHGESSDIRAWWPACRDYEPKETSTDVE